MHQQHQYKVPDEEFIRGNLSLLVPGNKGRVLDGRRTPGYIEEYNPISAMFIWRITGFEDEGKTWEIPAEQIVYYQFEKNSKTLSSLLKEEIENRCKVFSKSIIIKGSHQALKNTEKQMKKQELIAEKWLKEHSTFLKNKQTICFSQETGYKALYQDSKQYFTFLGLEELEERTAQNYILNPSSGEWLKGMKIVMAEMGLIDFKGLIPRTEDIFTGVGDKQAREKYILSRMAFLKVLFHKHNIKEVPLYRGMSSEMELFKSPRSLLSTTFNINTALSFANFTGDNEKIKSSYCVKFYYPVDNLFMTFFETEAFNQRYKEQEGIILYQQDRNL